MIYIDADSMVYAAGFASEGIVYNVQGTVVDKEADAYELATILNIPESDIKKEISVKPLSFGTGVLDDYMRLCSDKYPGPRRVFLTGNGNYREQVATIKPYKGNRTGVKPAWYNELRDHLIKRYGAEVVHGEEADDAIATACTAAPGVIVSIDKDFMQVPGLHWNWRTQEEVDVSEHEAWANLYTQALTGDPTDNIPGLYQMTGMKASKSMKDTLKNLRTPKEMYEYVLSMYTKGHLLTGILPDDTDIPRDWLNEIMTLLYLKRHPDDKWVPPCA